jgi:NADPH:quinone reductase
VSATETTHAIVATDFGGPDVLELVEVDLPEPGPREVVLDVRAAGINPIDFKRFSGQGYAGADRSLLPMRVGFEASGVISAVGSDATGPAGPIAVGDEVIAFRIDGAYAERVVIPAATVVPKPPSVGFEPAAGLMLAGVTAVHCLVATSVGEGETCLVHGGSGGVGLFLVQLGVARGARVIATASPRNHAALEALGAVPVAYGDGLLERVRELAPDGVDAAVDAVGTDEALDVSLALVADHARIVTIVVTARSQELGIQGLGGHPKADPGTEIRMRARLELAELAGGGQLELVTHVYPLAEASTALAELMKGHTRGKIVLVP